MSEVEERIRNLQPASYEEAVFGSSSRAAIYRSGYKDCKSDALRELASAQATDDIRHLDLRSQYMTAGTAEQMGKVLLAELAHRGSVPQGLHVLFKDPEGRLLALELSNF